MKIRTWKWAGVCLGAALTQAWAPAVVHAQGCVASQDAAVGCFVSNSVKTGLTSLRYGMNMTQFKAYGVAVSKILQAQQAYLVLAGMSSAIADAMPPTNANGTANASAQKAAVSAIVHAEILCGLVTLPAEANEQQAQWLSLDMITSMSETKGIILSPGFLLRVTDSYIVNATSAGVVNWTQVNSQLASMVSSLASTGLLKLPSNVTLANAQSFAQDLAQAIYTYKQATGRATL